MAKMVGYSCNLKLQWLNYAVSILEEGLDESNYKEKLNEYLLFEIDSSTRLRKTREIIMNTWYYRSEKVTPMRQEALNLLKRYPEYAVALHLCMIYLAYPVVADICKFMGRLFEYQDEITNAVLSQKLFDEWGERGALESTCRRVTLTLKDMGILETRTRLRYRLLKKTISNPDIVNFIIEIAMKADGASYYPFDRLSSFDILFPFEYVITKQQLMESNKFMIGIFGGELSVSLNS